MADSPFKLLIDTTSLWLPALTWLVARLSATRPGRKIEEELKARLKWLRDPEVEKAFQSAFGKGIQQYEQRRGQLPAAQAVAQVLRDVAEHDLTDLDQATVLDQIFEAKPDIQALGAIVRNHFGVITAEAAPEEVVTAELGLLISKYLRPAFRKERVFTERVGFAEIIRLLEDIQTELAAPAVDLESLRRDYCNKIIQKYEYISTQGISPKVQNRTIGIRMQDVFIPLLASVDDPDAILDALEERIVILARKPWPMIGNRQMRLERLREQLIDLEEGFHYAEKAFGGGLWPSGTAPSGRIGQLRSELDAIHLPEGSEAADAQLIIHLVRNSFTVLLAYVAKVRRERQTKPGPNDENLPPADIKDILSNMRVVVKGNPGSGKSTLTGYVVWATATGNIELLGQAAGRRLPLRVRAIEFGEALQTGHTNSLEEFVIDDSGRFAPLAKFAMASGNALVIVDGLDEVNRPALRAKVKERVDDFVSDPVFSDVQVLITTRIVGYERSGLLGHFPHFTLAELSDGQITEFVRNWYRAIHNEMPAAINVETEQQQLLEAILRKESIHRLARNPLLLTIIALIKWQGRALPDQRVLLYDAAAQTLIRTWPKTLRDVELDELFIREWLAPIALFILTNSASDLIDEYSLMEQLVVSMRRLQPVTNLEAQQRSQQLLDDVSLHSGILLPRGADADGRTLYGFLHQTFAEYLAAYDLVGRWEDRELELAQYAHDPYWREVVLLMSGYLGTQRRGKAGQFIQAICELQSSPYEFFVHRDLLLAGEILGDGVPIGPGDTVERILRQLLELWQRSTVNLLELDAEIVLGGLQDTEYASVVARLAHEMRLDPNHLLSLASRVGARYFSDDLVPLLQASDPSIKLRAAEMLLDVESAPAELALDTLLGAEDWRIRRKAADLLLPRGSSRAASTLRELVGMGKFVAVRRLVEVASSEGPQALMDLVMNEESSRLRIHAARSLLTLDETLATLALHEIVNASDLNTQIEAAAILAGRGDKDAICFLANLSGHQNPDTRLSVATALVGANDARGTTLLVELLSEKDPDISLWAAWALVDLKDQRGIDAVVQHLNVEDPRTCLDAAGILSGQKNPRVIEALRQMLMTGDPATQIAAINLLAKEEIVPDLTTLGELLTSESPNLVLKAAQLLTASSDPKGVEALVDLMANQNTQVRVRAAECLCSTTNSLAYNTACHELGRMMQDMAKIESSSGTSETPQSVADVAYQFLKRYLSPAGELESNLQPHS